MTGLVQDAVAAFQRGELDEARQRADRALALEPDSAPLKHLIGLIECRQGKVESGVGWLKGASDAAPQNAPFRIMLMRALVDCGRPAEAFAEALRPVGTSPPELAMWHARAEAAQAAGEWAAAEEAWGALTSGQPNDWRAWSNRGDALSKCERWSEAAAAFRRAAELNPGELKIRRNLASALGRSGDYAGSVAELRRLIAGQPLDAQLHLNLARSLGGLGLHPEAMAAFDRATELVTAGAPASDGAALMRAAVGERGDGHALSGDERDAVRELATLLERSNRLEALQAFLGEAERLGMARHELGFAAVAVALRTGNAEDAMRLLKAVPAEADAVQWHRAMSAAADALNDPATAFAEAEAMNRATPDYEEWRARGLDYRQQARGSAEAMRDWPAELPSLAPAERRSPAFLVGFPRSGTTLADTFLMGHRDVRVLEEVPLLAAAEAQLDIAALPRCGTELLAAARAAYFAELDRHVDPGFAGLVVDKMPLNMIRLPLISSLFPDARIIFAQRHPCDCVLSGFLQHFALNPAMACFLDLDAAADLYDAAMSLFALGRAQTPGAVRDLIYEALVEDPEASLRPLVEWLGLDWQAGLLDHRGTAARRGTIGTPSYHQVVEPLTRRPSGRWQRYQAQMAPVLPVLLPWAEWLGYAKAPVIIPN